MQPGFSRSLLDLNQLSAAEKERTSPGNEGVFEAVTELINEEGALGIPRKWPRKSRRVHICNNRQFTKQLRPVKAYLHAKAASTNRATRGPGFHPASSR